MPRLVYVLAVLAAVFVLWSSSYLPLQVASHFGVSGQADAYTSRFAFAAIMLAVVSVLPLLVWRFQCGIARARKTNIPNRDYWFADNRYVETVRYLELHAAWFCVVFTLFMLTVHWLVVAANNDAQNSQLNTPVFLTALGLFAAFAIGWTATFYLRFRKQKVDA